MNYIRVALKILKKSILNFYLKAEAFHQKKQFAELFNIDIENEDFWEKGINTVRKMLNEFKEISSDYRK